jgi:hypothetical protein
MRWNNFKQKAGFDIDAATLAAATPKFERVRVITVNHR